MEAFANFSKKYWWLIVLGVLGLFLLMGIGTFNSFVGQEAGIEASSKKMENALGAGYKKITSQGLAVDKYGTLFKDAIKAGMSGRYGKDGSQGAMQWIRESNPQLDAKIMQALQDAIEVTFNRFEAAQNEHIDRVRVYKFSLGKFPDNVVAGVFGFPKLDLARYKEVISSKEAKEAMTTKELPTPSM